MFNYSATERRDHRTASVDIEKKRGVWSFKKPKTNNNAYLNKYF